MTEFEIRAVWPEVPDVEQWSRHLANNKGQNWHTNFGPLSKKFENALHAGYGLVGEAVVSTCSATSGITACLIAHDIQGPVLCPAFTFQASPCAILGAGCTPVIVDVDRETRIVPVDVLRAALVETQAKAVLLVAPYGISFDATEHAEVCQRAGARLIIDNAAGLGIDRARAFQRQVTADVDEVFSLHATKPFGIGEGGAIFSSVANEAALRSAINFGLTSHTGNGIPKPPYWGINGKMSEAAAAVGLAVAESIAERVKNRQIMAHEWYETFADYPQICLEANIEHAPWQVFPIFLPTEAVLLRFLDNMAARGIELRRYYFPSLGDCGGLRSFGDCEVSRSLSRRVVVLPVRSFMPKEQRALLMKSTLQSLEQSMTVEN